MGLRNKKIVYYMLVCNTCASEKAVYNSKIDPQKTTGKPVGIAIVMKAVLGYGSMRFTVDNCLSAFARIAAAIKALLRLIAKIRRLS